MVEFYENRRHIFPLSNSTYLLLHVTILNRQPSFRILCKVGKCLKLIGTVVNLNKHCGRLVCIYIGIFLFVCIYFHIFCLWKFYFSIENLNDNHLLFSLKRWGIFKRPPLSRG